VRLLRTNLELFSGLWNSEKELRETESQNVASGSAEAYDSLFQDEQKFDLVVDKHYLQDVHFG